MRKVFLRGLSAAMAACGLGAPPALGLRASKAAGDLAPPGDYLPWSVVRRRTSLSRTTAWRLQKRGDFPAPYTISPGWVGYREDEVEAWRASRDPSGPRLKTPVRTAEPAPAVSTGHAAQGDVLQRDARSEFPVRGVDGAAAQGANPGDAFGGAPT